MDKEHENTPQGRRDFEEWSDEVLSEPRGRSIYGEELESLTIGHTVLCSKCHAKIVFRRQVTYPDAELKQGARSNPIDAEPSENGNILLLSDGQSYQIVPPGERESYKGELHVSHYATCKYAKDFGQRAGK